MVFAGLTALLLATSSAVLEERVLLVVPTLGDATPTATPTAIDHPIPTVSPSAGQLELTHGGEERRWYGYQLIISDAISIGLFLLGGELIASHVTCPTDSPCPTSSTLDGVGLVAAAAGTFGLVPPLIHLLHGQYWNALGSLGLRVAIPLLTGLALAGTSGQALVGIEILIAMIIDDAYLADEPARRAPLHSTNPVEPNASGPRGAVGLAYRGLF